MSFLPVLKRCFRASPVAGVGTFLASEREQFLLSGEAYLKLLPLLDGGRTREDVVAALEGTVSAPEVYYALELLRSNGYVVDGSVLRPPGQAAFWDLLEVAPEQVAHRLAETTVAISTVGAGLDGYADRLRSELAALGVRMEAEGDLCVVLADDYLQAGLEELNREALTQARPWLLLKPCGLEGWLGPLFVPWVTGCHACLERRLQGHRKLESYLHKKTQLPRPLGVSVAALPSTVGAVVATAATEVAKWVVLGRSEALEGRVVTLDAASLERRSHVLTRRPQCPRCGVPALVAARQWRRPVLETRPTIFNQDGGHRSTSTEDALARLTPHLSPITGIVSELRPVTNDDGDRLTNVFVADHNASQTWNDLYFLEEMQRSRAAGKGKTPAQSRASALGESIERYSGVYQGDEAALRARLADLGEAAIHPHALLLISERQYAERRKWNALGSRFTKVPEPFDESQVVEWAPVWPLLGGEARYIPMACCYYDYTKQAGVSFAWADSNGCAAGFNLEEAAYQGLLELVERDAVAVWWYNRVRRPGVDLAGFGEPYLHELSGYYRTLHRDLWALDLTHDLGIPVFVALSRRNDKPAEDIIFGFGAHLDPRIALLRAVTEMNQSLPFVANPERGYGGDELMARWHEHSTTETDPYLVADPSQPLRQAGDSARPTSGDILEDLMTCARTLREHGVETYLHDQSRPDTGLAVVRVVAPGLRHYWPRFAPGRLYDVPVRLGWLPRATAEEDLNPTPMVL